MLSEHESPTETAPARVPWRWAIMAVLVVISIYPVIRRLAVHANAPPPAASTAAINLSFQAFNAGQFERTITYAKVALQADRNSADAYNNIAAAYARLRNWDLAIQNIQHALRLRPGYQLAKNNLAWYLQQKAGAPPSASAPTPGTSDFYVNLSLQRYQTGKYPESINAARQAIRLNPQTATAYKNIAASSAMRIWDEAIAAAQQAMRIDPGLQIARNNLAWAISEKQKAASGYTVKK